MPAGGHHQCCPLESLSKDPPRLRSSALRSPLNSASVKGMQPGPGDCAFAGDDRKAEKQQVRTAAKHSPAVRDDIDTTPHISARIGATNAFIRAYEGILRSCWR